MKAQKIIFTHSRNDQFLARVEKLIHWIGEMGHATGVLKELRLEDNGKMYWSLEFVVRNAAWADFFGQQIAYLQDKGVRCDRCRG